MKGKKVLPDQKCTLRHGERYPNRPYHRGQTTKGRTWGPHGVPPAGGQGTECGLGYR